MNYWVKLKTWNGGQLQSQGESNSQLAKDADAELATGLALRPPIWVGRAASLADDDRVLVSQRLKRVSVVLHAVSSVQRKTGVEIQTLKGLQQRVARQLAAAGFTIDSQGGLHRKPVPPGVPSATSTGEQEYADFFIVQHQAKTLDESAANQLDALTGQIADAKARFELLDELHAQRLTAISGALDGVAWEFDWDFKELLARLPKIGNYGPNGGGGGLSSVENFHTPEELTTSLLVTGRFPVYIERLLYGGKGPQGTEREAALAYLAMATGKKPSGIFGLFLSSYVDKFGSPEFADDKNPYTPSMVKTLGPDEMDLMGKERLTGLGDLTSRMTAMYGFTDIDDKTDRPVVEVRVIESPGKPPKFIAVFPGTTLSYDRPEGWTGDIEGTDWAANFKAMGFGTSSAIESGQAAVEQAIDQAVNDYEKRTGQPVVRPQVALAGHSQGGIIASEIGSNELFASRYDVTHVVTAGSPVDQVTMNGTERLSIVNEFDPVPRLDGFLTPTEGVTEVQYQYGMDKPKNPMFEGFLGEQHGYDVYEYRTKVALQQPPSLEGPGLENSAGTKLAKFEESMAGYFTPDAKVTTMHVTFGRQ